MPNEAFEFWMKTKLQSDGTIMPRSSAAIGCAVATFDYMRKLDEETIKKIELDISRTLIKKGIKPTRLVFDTTNFYTHIENGEELPQKSHSKEKRYDKNLVGIGLIASDHDIPFQSITYPANVSDSDIFPEIIDSICERLQNIDIPAEDMTIIFDRGMNSTLNIEKQGTKEEKEGFCQMKLLNFG